MMDRAQPSFILKFALPGWNEGGGGNDFAGGVNGADEREEAVGDGVFGGVHSWLVHGT